MNPLMEQLHDIEGLDPISSWPLAIGWWIVMAVGVAAAIAIACYVAYKLAYRRSWKNDTIQKLTALEKNLSEDNARDTVISLSEYLRRIVIRRYPRQECAGLMGTDWLKWLAKNDAKKFDWEKNGVLLIEVPYAPEGMNLPVNQIKVLIQAARHWVR